VILGILPSSPAQSLQLELTMPKQSVPIDAKTILSIVGGGTSKEYRKKQIIFAQGAPADEIFYIQKGRVRLSVVSNQGKEAVIAILGPSDFFGEGCLAGQPLRIATAHAVTDCSTLRLQKAATIRALHNNPGFSEMFITYLLSRNILRWLARCRVRSRLAVPRRKSHTR
jgi:CRP/FNR family transcriptional regulator, cyclic AMP receptor protein